VTITMSDAPVDVPEVPAGPPGVPAEELLRLDTGTLSPLIKRLEAVGYVRREGSTRDEQ
jgi:hypothetical protein